MIIKMIQLVSSITRVRDDIDCIFYIIGNCIAKVIKLEAMSDWTVYRIAGDTLDKMAQDQNER